MLKRCTKITEKRFCVKEKHYAGTVLDFEVNSIFNHFKRTHIQKSMNTLKQFFTPALFILSVAAFGQIKTEKPMELPYIEVTGTAEKEVIPDEIYIGIIIKEKYINKIKTTVEEQEEKLKNAIKSLGIDLTNLYLSDIDADYVKIRWQKNDLLTRKDYTLKVTDATTVGKIFQELDKLEVSDAYISRISHSKMEVLRKEIKIMAIKAAKEKADYLLTAIGEQTGKPLVIHENELHLNKNLSSNFRSIPGAEDELWKVKNSNNEIEFQKIKIQASMYVKFSIK